MVKKSVLIASVAVLATCSGASASTWYTSTSGTIYQISYGTPSSNPEYAVIDLTSGYMRFNTGPTSGWGTSVIVVPSYWSGGNLYQGYPVAVTSKISGTKLLLTLTATSNKYHISETNSIAPPTATYISAVVTATLTGSMPLENNPGQAFKPVMLSSMHDSSTVWDSVSAFAGKTTYKYPTGGWIVSNAPVVSSNAFGCTGGTSTWKKNSPTVTIVYGSTIQIAGWLTSDSNPNDDNVGLWCATAAAPSTWTYDIITSQGAAPSSRRP
jgi:hypothetical protein